MFRPLLVLSAMLVPLAALAEPVPVPVKVLSFNIWYGGDQVDFAAVIAAIRAADADVVGLQEPDGKTLQIAALAGYPYADVRRHIISKYPIFDSGKGETTSEEVPPYSIAGLDPDAVAAWIQIRPGQVIAVANTHLTSDPYGPEMLRDGATPEEVLQNEADTRMPEAQALIDGLKPLVDKGVPVILTGDFNSPSWRDWQGRSPAIEWPVSKALEDAGFVDGFRNANPDIAIAPGLTWTAGRPWPYLPEGETHDRIDFTWGANAMPKASTVMGEPGNAQNGLQIAPWPSDHRAVLTTFEVTPIETPPLVTVEPRPVPLGSSFLIRVALPTGAAPFTAWVVPRGGAADAALTGIEAVDPADRPTIRLTSQGMAAGEYDAILLDEAGTELARSQFSVIAADGLATIAATNPVIAVGADIPLTFTGAPGFKLDWVGVYAKGEPSVYNYLGFAYTNARINGGLTFPADALYAPLEPGEYELRLMFDDHYQALATGGFTVK
jgi:endonuclease/exonuclease/phosphatase family metal-dependent hydrolase